MFIFKLPLLIVTFLCCGTLTAVRASTASAVDLLQGDHLRGACMNVENGVMTWRTPYGDTLHIPVGDIRALNPGETWDLEFSDGQRMKGAWEITEGVLTVPSAVFGVLRCSPGQLRSAIRAVSARGVGDPPAAAPADATPAATSPAPPVSTPAANEAPPSSLQTMLRESSVLLRPREWSVSTTFNYTHNRALYSPTETRLLAVDARIQRGITPRVEAAIEWPAYWMRTATSSVTNSTPPAILTSHTDKTRVGDPEVSASTLLFHEGARSPECVAVTGLTIPVNDIDQQSFFRTRLGLEFLKTSDPGALFAGFAWVRDWDGWQSSPYKHLDHLRYHLGAAIGLNDELAIGFQVQAEYIAELKDRAGRLLNPSQEPVLGRFWFNFRANQRTFVEASVDLPMNDDAHGTTFGVTCIRRY